MKFAFQISVILLALFHPGKDLQAEEPPLTWPRCVELALKHNPDFRLAQAQVQEAEGRILSERANFMPKVTVTGVSLPPTLVFGFTQPVYSSAMQPSLRAFAAGKSAAYTNVQLTLLEMIFQLRVAFAKTIYTRELIQVFQEEVDLMENRLKRAPSLFEAGKLTKSDLVALEVRVSLSREKLLNAINNAERAKLELAQLMGISMSHPSWKLGLEGTLESALPPDLDVAKLGKQALQNRLDLRLLRSLKLLADQQIRIARSSDDPMVLAFANSSIEAGSPSFLQPVVEALDPQSAVQDEDNEDIKNARAVFGGLVSWRIFDGGSTMGRVTEARFEVAQQSVFIQKLEQEIPRQVEQAVLTVQSAAALLTKLEKDHNPQENLELLRRSFEAGDISQLEILDATEQAIRFKEQKWRFRYNLAVALAFLDRATGERLRILSENP